MTMTNLHYEKRALSIYCKIRAPNLIYNRYAKRVFVNYILDPLKQAKFLNHDDLPKHGEYPNIRRFSNKSGGRETVRKEIFRIKRPSSHVSLNRNILHD